MKRGILETVASIACFTFLIAYMKEPLWLVPMVAFNIVFLGLGGDCSENPKDIKTD